MEDNNVYLYMRDGVECITPSFRLAYLRSAGSAIVALTPEGLRAEVITK